MDRLGMLTMLTLSLTAAHGFADAPKVPDLVAHRGSCEERPENTLASIQHAMQSGATAVEVDVRWTKDRRLVLLHDEKLDRTTNGRGPVGEMTWDELRKLDAGSWFDPKFKDEKVPELHEVLALCKGKIGVMLDLKVQGEAYAEQVAADVRRHGEESRTIVGVRSIEQARQFRRLLPAARLYGLIPQTTDIEGFAAAGCETIRLWPRWLTDSELVPRVRKTGARLHLGVGLGTLEEVRPLLPHQAESLSTDNPARLVQTLKDLGRP